MLGYVSHCSENGMPMMPMMPMRSVVLLDRLVNPLGEDGLSICADFCSKDTFSIWVSDEGLI